MYMRGVYHSLQIVAFLVFVVCAVVLLGTADSCAQNIRISFPQDIGDYDLGEEFSVPLVFENPSGFEPDEFNLLISFPSYFLTLIEVLPTPYDSGCGWSNFDVTQPDDSLIRIVGTAGAGACLSVDSIVLASLRFEVSADSSAVAQGGILSFVFIDCSDNTLLELDGDSVFFSDTVYGEPYTSPMPSTGQGTPDYCVEAVVGLRRISYAAGFVTTKFPPIPSRGDINLNGLTFEIADWVMYTNYFVHGLTAFNPPTINESIINSDCNADGRTLTIPDLVFTHEVIIGDTLPFPTARSVDDTAVFVQDMNAKTVVLDYVEPVAAIFLEFGGEITPTPLFDTSEGMELAYELVDGYTRVLVIFPLAVSGEPTVSPGPILSYTGEAALIRSDLSTWDAFWIPSEIDYLNGSCCIGSVGNVNYSPDDVVDISDLTSLVNFLFLDPNQIPPCLAEANVNGDIAGEIDISDLTALVAYLFALSTDPLPACQ